MMMLPLLETQHVFRNRDDSPYGFGAIDGTKVPRRFRERFPVTGASAVVMASDGYVEPAESLEEAERHLARLLREDPLRLGPPPGTKGCAPGATSFDDRAYLRLTSPGGSVMADVA